MELNDILSPDKESKYKSEKDIEMLDLITLYFSESFNEWEIGFIDNLKQSPWVLTQKQISKVKDIATKYKHRAQIQKYLHP
tara:strand:- start:338 stop:580 length:243 start_codon:yes stop_codon:yes gene_type:complete